MPCTCMECSAARARGQRVKSRHLNRDISYPYIHHPLLFVSSALCYNYSIHVLYSGLFYNC
jgi:hypothetical protein